MSQSHLLSFPQPWENPTGHMNISPQPQTTRRFSFSLADADSTQTHWSPTVAQ